MTSSPNLFRSSRSISSCSVRCFFSSAQFIGYSFLWQVLEPTNPEMSAAIFRVLNGLLDTSIHKFFLYAFFHAICRAMKIYAPWTFIAFHGYKPYYSLSLNSRQLFLYSGHKAVCTVYPPGNFPFPIFEIPLLEFLGTAVVLDVITICAQEIFYFSLFKGKRPPLSCL